MPGSRALPAASFFTSYELIVFLKGFWQYVLAIAYQTLLFLAGTAKIFCKAAFSYLFNQLVIVDVFVQ